MTYKGMSDEDHVFYRLDGWFFFDKDGQAVGPYKDHETALGKWREYELYRQAH